MKKILNNEYSIESLICKGGYSIVYLVKDNKTQKEYAAKIITKYNSYSPNELKICQIIKEKIKSPYLIEFIENGIFQYQKDKKIIKNQEYYLFNYASKGNLWKYCKIEPFKELFCKIIFEKILKGIKSLHENGICHLDIKPNNILLDYNFIPKICDFGFANFIIGEDGSGKLHHKLGTSIFKTPQMYLKTSYNGIKADIFSLGVTLFVLLTNRGCFIRACKEDKFYNTFVKNYNKYKDYLQNRYNFNEVFLDLFSSMIAMEEKNRPENIDEILNHQWFKEINELSNDNRMILEEQVRLEFEKREQIFNQKTQLEVNTNSSKRIYERTNKKNEYFAKDINPKLITKELKTDNYMKIKGNLNPNEFMNNLAYEINYLYDAEIEQSQKNLKFICIFKKKEINLSEIEEISDDDDDILNLENINQSEKDCIIQIKLFKLKNEEHLLRIRKQYGEIYDYYHHLLNILNKAKKLLI